jgi:putative NADH-flavin reductase
MKLVVFGASGRTGRPLVEQALAQGHDVTAYVRTPSKLADLDGRPNLRLVQGDVYDAAKVAEAVAGQDAVLSALGPEKPAFDQMQTGARYVLAAMKEHGVRRLVTLTGAGVPAPQDRPTLVNKAIAWLLKRINPEVLADAQAHVDLVRASDVDWTVVRVPRLVDGPHTGKVRVGWAGVGTGIRINRADAADFMLRQLSDTTHLRQMPMISN